MTEFRKLSTNQGSRLPLENRGDQINRNSPSYIDYVDVQCHSATIDRCPAKPVRGLSVVEGSLRRPILRGLKAQKHVKRSPTLRKKIFGILLISLSALALLISAACDSSKSKSVGSPENLTIGTYLGDLSALFWIAKDRGYFSEQSVNVQLQTHESGLESYMDLLAGKVDLATITEFVFARNVLETA